MENQNLYKVSFVQADKTGKYQEYTITVFADNKEGALALAKIDNPFAEELIVTLVAIY